MSWLCKMSGTLPTERQNGRAFQTGKELRVKAPGHEGALVPRELICSLLLICYQKPASFNSLRVFREENWNNEGES